MALLFQPESEHYKWAEGTVSWHSSYDSRQSVTDLVWLHLCTHTHTHICTQHTPHKQNTHTHGNILLANTPTPTTTTNMYTHTQTYLSWLCHIDDDIYVNLEVLVRTLSIFYPRKEPVYFGRSGSDWFKPRQVKRSAKLGRPSQRYHFAVGGMYCLSRAMLEMAKPYIVWVPQNFFTHGESCHVTVSIHKWMIHLQLQI